MAIAIGAITLALMIFSLVDIITSENWQVKHLPKMLWILIIIFLPLIGSIIWLLVGKERRLLAEGWGSMASQNRPVDAAPPPTLSTTEQELAALEREIEFAEKQEKLKRLEAELERKRQDRSQP